MCSSGAEANENALKLASFHTNKATVIAFENSFHGRTSACVAATDNPKIVAPINAQQQVRFLPLGDLDLVEITLKSEPICAIIIECIQGVGGLDESSTNFYKGLELLCQTYNTVLIADEVQSGFGRTGDFFAFQKHGITPHIISMAKGMGNGFPVGGLLIHPDIKPWSGMLGTTFGGNYLACAATLSVLEVIEEEDLMTNAVILGNYWMEQLCSFASIQEVRGRGLMIGFDLPDSLANLRKDLLFKPNSNISDSPDYKTKNI